MHVVACAAPLGFIEPAPLTSLPTGLIDAAATISAQWVGDDYCLRAQSDSGTTWYRIDAEQTDDVADDQTRRAMAELLMNVTPIGHGRVAFPAGSSGRTVYRVWRSRSAGAPVRTKILAVRAGRSRRLPA